VSWEEYAGEILISEDKLQARIAELGQAISADYAGKDLLLVCVLKGGVMFLTDLMRHITVPHSIDFMAVSSYGVAARESSGVVRILMDLSTNIEGRHVLIVSLRICTLLNKVERREVDIPLDYVGFDIPNKFVFGYGLDLDELYRDLPFVAVLKPELIS